MDRCSFVQPTFDVIRVDRTFSWNAESRGAADAIESYSEVNAQRSRLRGSGEISTRRGFRRFKVEGLGDENKRIYPSSPTAKIRNRFSGRSRVDTAPAGATLNITFDPSHAANHAG